MGKIHKNWVYIALFIFVILFYWFQIRPSNIRSECKTRSAERITKDMGQEKRSAETWQKWYDLYYGTCLNEKGLK